MELKTALLSAVMCVGLVGCGRVAAGYEGVIVDMYGSEKGVQGQEAGVGWHFVPPGKELYKFPTFTQNIVWTADETEGSRNDESIDFQDKDGLVLNADVGMSYFVQSGKASDAFVKYRRGIDEITDIFLRNMVRDELVNISSTMTAEEAYSTRKMELIRQAKANVSKRVESHGIIIEDLFWVGPIRLPTSVQAAVDAKIEATQIAAQRQNEVATAEAEAQKKVAAAQGEAESIRVVAEARAEAIRIEGEALRDNPNVIKLREVEQWNGQYPNTLVSGDNQPFLMLDSK